MVPVGDNFYRVHFAYFVYVGPKDAIKNEKITLVYHFYTLEFKSSLPVRHVPVA